MAFQSPYRGEESLLSPRSRNLLSRGTLLVVGLVMLIFATRGLLAIDQSQRLAATQPGYTTSPPPMFGQPRQLPDERAGLLLVVPLGLLGLATTAAALVPLTLMQRVLERFNSPPITGDRDLGDEMIYGRNARRRALGLPWWWPF